MAWGALLLGRLLRGLLFGIAATDAPTFAGAVAILATVALLSCYIPARRAARLEPVSSLRSE